MASLRPGEDAEDLCVCVHLFRWSGLKPEWYFRHKELDVVFVPRGWAARAPESRAAVLAALADVASEWAREEDAAKCLEDAETLLEAIVVLASSSAYVDG